MEKTNEIELTGQVVETSLTLSKKMKRTHGQILDVIETMYYKANCLDKLKRLDYKDVRGRMRKCYELNETDMMFIQLYYDKKKIQLYQFIEEYQRLKRNENKGLGFRAL